MRAEIKSIHERTANIAEGEKILIVDDDPGLSSLLERFSPARASVPAPCRTPNRWTACWPAKCSTWWCST
jgi:hypothetical protein